MMNLFGITSLRSWIWAHFRCVSFERFCFIKMQTLSASTITYWSQGDLNCINYEHPFDNVDSLYFFRVNGSIQLSVFSKLSILTRAQVRNYWVKRLRVHVFLMLKWKDVRGTVLPRMDGDGHVTWHPHSTALVLIT